MSKSSAIMHWAEAHQPGWAEQAIEAWDDDRLTQLLPFVKSHYWSDRHSVNVHSVVGTAHPDYIGLTWREFLHQGKRMPVNQQLLADNPIYYDETHVKAPSMLYVSLNGKHWYVNGDGNHRTCLARYYFELQNLEHSNTKTMIHGVTVDDYRVDWDLFHLYDQIQQAFIIAKVPEQVFPARTHIERQDGPGWKIDKYRVELIHRSASGEQCLNTREIRKLLNRLEQRSGSFLSWFRRSS